MCFNALDVRLLVCNFLVKNLLLPYENSDPDLLLLKLSFQKLDLFLQVGNCAFMSVALLTLLGIP